MAGVVAPLLVLLMGLPGAGKSTLAALLATRFRLAIVDRDRLRAARFPRLGYGRADKALLNRALQREAARLLRQRRSVILDGMTFAAHAQRRTFRRLAERLRARCLAVLVECPPDVAASRVRDGVHPAPDRTPALVADVARRFQPVDPRTLRVSGLSSQGIKPLIARLRRLGAVLR